MARTNVVWPTVRAATNESHRDVVDQARCADPRRHEETEWPVLDRLHPGQAAGMPRLEIVDREAHAFDLGGPFVEHPGNLLLVGDTARAVLEHAIERSRDAALRVGEIGVARRHREAALLTNNRRADDLEIGRAHV